MKTIGRNDLPAEQQHALKKAIRWEWVTIGYTSCTVLLVALVVGNSQAMKTAWIEDMLSLVPQVSFLVALLFVRKPPTKAFPFGFHRAMGIGHLVAGVALFVVGANLAVESSVGLIMGERPSIGTVQLFGHTVWMGWLMIAVMAVVVVGPLVYGPAKLKLAPLLHNKVLYADADMARADWHTNVASIVGILGVGVGLWWLDGAAAIFISIGIVRDGITNTRFAVRDLIDERSRTYDNKRTHPLVFEILQAVRELPWVQDAGIRMRDQGQVFDIEVFFIPSRRRPPRTEIIEAATRRIAEVDWRVQDIVLVPVTRIPDEATQ